MSPSEFKLLTRRSGFRIEFSEKYGNGLWQRAYIKKDGVQYGCVKFHCNEYYNLKWYGVSGVEFEVFCLEMLMNYHYLPTIEEYNLTWYWAEKAANERHARKVALRNSLPFKKRRALTPPNPWHFFHRIFIYKWITFRGLA